MESNTHISVLCLRGNPVYVTGLELARVPRVPRVPGTRRIFGQ